MEASVAIGQLAEGVSEPPFRDAGPIALPGSTPPWRWPAIVGLEVRSAIRARWSVAAVGLSLALALFFVAVATRESSIVGFTGFGRVLDGVVQAGLLFVPLLALLSTTQAITAARQQGVLEWYLSYPNGRARCYAAIVLPRLAAIVIPVVVTTGLLGVAPALMGQPVPGTLLGDDLALLAGQAACFGGLGAWISASSRTPEEALLRALGAWMALVALVDFAVLAVMLRWQLPPQIVFAIAAVNPVQAGRVGILAAMDPTLGVLGPVGTWATLTFGTPAVIAWGLGWPVVLAGGLLGMGLRAFRRLDVG